MSTFYQYNSDTMSANLPSSQPTSSIRRIMNSMQPASFSRPPASQPAVKSGWLRKEGGVIKSWHRRWFVIKGDQMYYYAGQDEQKLLGQIPLAGNHVKEIPHVIAEPDKFHFEIVPGGTNSRMTTTHETYPLCAATEEERRGWIQTIKKVMYADQGGGIFGQSLKETMAYEAKTSNRKVPQIVEMCVEFLLENGLDVEGIFRLPGRNTVIKKLRDAFDVGERPEFTMDNYDVHSIASLLKLYLRELPQPLIPSSFYEPVMKFCIRGMQENPDASLQKLGELLHQIPHHNYNVLQYLCKFLNEVDKHKDQNKMPAMNLATVFMHNIIEPEDKDPVLLMGTANTRTQVAFLLISQIDWLFSFEYNHSGAKVTVDNLIDIGAMPDSTDGFKADTSAPQTEPLTNSNHIWDNEFTGALPTPLTPADPPLVEISSHYSDPADFVPATKDRPLSMDPLYAEVYDAKNGHDASVKKPETAPTVPARPPRPPRPVAIISSCSSEETFCEDDSAVSTPCSEGSYGSMTSDLSPPSNPPARPALPTRPAPPPPAPKQQSFRSQSIDSLDTDSGVNDAEDDDEIDTLLNTDLSAKDSDQLRTHIKALYAEMKLQRAKNKEMSTQMSLSKEKHRRKLNEMAKKLEEEKEATANAVERVVQLQTELLLAKEQKIHNDLSFLNN